MAGLICGYACEFVESVSKELQIECSVCLHTVKDPYMVDCCGYRFCKTCIEPLVPNKKCPLCNCQFTSVIQDKLLLRTLNQKKVYCTHKTGGCEWIGELALLDKHLNAQPESGDRMKGCAIQAVKCKHCSGQIQRNQLESHESSCPQRLVTCQYCKKYTAKHSKVLQHLSICGDVPVCCPSAGCEAKIKRSNMSKHVQQRCPYAIVPCEYAYAGCRVRVLRKAMTEHVESATKHHLDLLSSHCAEQKKKVKKLQSKLQNLKHTASQSASGMEQSHDDISTNTLKELLDLRSHCNDSDCEVLVSNLPVDAGEHMIKGLFGQHGQVKRIELYPNRNMAVVEYEDKSSVNRLLDYQKATAKGLCLRGSKLNCIRLSYY